VKRAKVQTQTKGGCSSKRGRKSCFSKKWVEWDGYDSL